MYVCMYVCVCIYIYIYIYIYNNYAYPLGVCSQEMLVARGLPDVRAGGSSDWDTPSPPTKSLGFRGFDSSRLLILRGGIFMSVDFDKGSPGKFDSRTLNRETLNRGIGRIPCQDPLMHNFLTTEGSPLGNEGGGQCMSNAIATRLSDPALGENPPNPRS